MEGYTKISQIGEGTFGKVYKAKVKDTNEFVAIKKMELDLENGFSFNTIREIKMLKKLKSKYVVELEDIFFEKEYLYIVMEFLPFDLTGLLVSDYKMSEDQIDSFIYQTLAGIGYIHDMGLIHRDIKPSNILINQNGQLKIADFGLTREKSAVMTNHVCTLWYRAPELLLGTEQYDTRVDSWSVGCVILEIITRDPPFKGSDEMSQIKSIFSAFGSSYDKYPWSELSGQRNYPIHENWEEFFIENYANILDKRKLKMLSALLTISPNKRSTPKDILNEFYGQGYILKTYSIDFNEVHEFGSRKRFCM